MNLSLKMSHYFKIFIKKIFLTLIFETETEHEWGEGQRERETQNLKQAPGSELSAQPDVGLKITDREITT